MVENRRICLDIKINSRPVRKFEGKKVYVSTGDSEDMANGEIVNYYERPSRANVEPKIDDIIFAKMANTDKTFLIDSELVKNIYSTGFFDVSSKRIYPKFLYYLIKSHEFDGYKNAYSEGTTQISISDRRLKKIRVSYETDYENQKKIAKYLDLKISSIEKLISNLKKQVDELNNQVESMIDEAIYGYKNSSIKKRLWIDSLPNDWQLTKLKALFAIRKGLGITKADLTEDGIPVISYGQTHNSNFIYEFNGSDNRLPCVPVKFLEQRQCIMNKGDFIFVDTSEDIKGSADFSMLNNDDICFAGYHSLLLKPRRKINSRYFMYLFRSYRWGNQIKSKVDGVKVYSITQTILGNVDLIIPPKKTQDEIVEKLDSYIKKIEDLIVIKKKKISELEKLKVSLIYECVSGNMEVA